MRDASAHGKKSSVSKQDNPTQINLEVPESLKEAYISHIKLMNQGHYRKLQSETISDALRLQITAWGLERGYDLHRCSDVSYIEDPDEFVSVVEACFRTMAPSLTQTQNQLRKLVDVDLKRLHQIRDIIHRPIPEQEIQDGLSLSGEDTTGISPRISPSLHMAYKSFIKLNNEGNYRNKQKDNIIEAMKLQIAVWILNHTYELEHCYDVDYIEDPDRFVSVALHCVQKKSDLLTEFLPQLDELSEIPPDEINKQIITTLPTRFEDDIKSGSDNLVRKKRFEVEHYAADVLKEIHENGDTELLIENTSYNKEDFDQIIDNIG